MKPPFLCICLLAATAAVGICDENKPADYFAHEVREDANGVIAPWCAAQSGPCDFRVRVSAETLKRYPWADAEKAVIPAPEYVYFSQWTIDENGTITMPQPYPGRKGTKFEGQWLNGDLGSRYYYVVSALTRYYAYSGDPLAFGGIKLYSDYLLDYGLTSKDHAWPEFPISCPTAGKYYGKSSPEGFIQTDYAAEVCRQMLFAGRFLGEPRYIEMAKHFGDVYAEKCNPAPGKSPWPRYANPEAVPWGKDADGNRQTGGSVAITRFLDELIDFGYTGKDGAIVKARDAGDRYLKETLLPNWSTGSNWGYFFWDWKAYTLNCSIAYWTSEYILDNPERFPNWRYNVRTLFGMMVFEASIFPAGRGGVYSGAWSYPESSSCCNDSNDYAPQLFSAPYLKYAAKTGCETMREMGRRQILLSTYDALDNGVVIDGLTGKNIVAKNWFKIAHPLALDGVLRAMEWLPEKLGPNRENHIMRTTAVVTHVMYGDGRVEYTVDDAKGPSVDVLRLAFHPTRVLADGKALSPGKTSEENGYEVCELPSGDCLVTVRHDGNRRVALEGDDPQESADDPAMRIIGQWETIPGETDEGGSCRVAETDGASIEMSFEGNQVRLIGRAAPDGGRADVYLDGKKLLAIVDCWAPKERHRQVLYYRNGLAPGKHVLKVVARGTKNLASKGKRVYVDGIQWSAAEGPVNFGAGGGSTKPQRIIFGYPGAKEYVDSDGNAWDPALFVQCPLAPRIDGIAKSWWRTPRMKEVAGTKDPVLYQHGLHAKDFTAHFTVKPDATYHVRIKLAESRDLPAKERAMNVRINGDLVAVNMDVEATAGGKNKAIDLVANDVKPKNGVISVRFSGSWIKNADGKRVQNEAIAQAIEIGPGDGGVGAVPAEVSGEVLEQ